MFDLRTCKSLSDREGKGNRMWEGTEVGDNTVCLNEAWCRVL